MTTLTPAYGRDYKSKKELQQDIDADRDFIINDIMSKYDGKPCTPRRDFKGKKIMFRYGNLRKTAVIQL